MTSEEQKIKNRQYVAKCRAKMSPEAKQYRNQQYCRSWEGWIKAKVYASIYEDIDKNRNNTITPEYINKLLEGQNGKCALTGIELTHDKSLCSMSIDRIDNKLGHITGNIHLVCMGVNLAKNRHTNGNVMEFVECIRGSRKFEPVKISRDYISSCVRNSKQSDRGKGLNNDMDTDYIIGVLNKQNKCCYFTGIPVACYQHPCFSISIDRIDNTIGHLRNNIRLVLKSINISKKNRPDAEFIEWLNKIKETDNASN